MICLGCGQKVEPEHRATCRRYDLMRALERVAETAGPPPTSWRAEDVRAYIERGADAQRELLRIYRDLLFDHTLALRAA